MTDRQAADEVRENLAWKCALGLTLDDPGFDHSVLSEFRTRVVEHQSEERVLDLLLERLRGLDLVQPGG
ncbi:transposase [Streptomyces kaniharaensis]|uniref:Transposase n=1 Tax=Streptomyces kaniharaensis TaxID=212423 RepID=A0A6N7KZY3_9ACTN|nr:transposase [Streptomyces kaniharaensis]